MDEEEYNQYNELPPYFVGIPSLNDYMDETMYLQLDRNEWTWIS